MTKTVRWTRGSEWHRWDPHIHTPATLRANQFGGRWDAYVERINSATPAAPALGITEYGSIEGYKEFRSRWLGGAFRGVDLIFPNVELRLTTQTKRGAGINIHLLFSPEDKDHVELIEKHLARLVFEWDRQKYGLSKADLIRLGRAFDPKQTDELGAFKVGAEQFKVELSELRDWLRGDAWLEANCLVAVATGQGDGTSGLQDDGAFAGQRQEIERFAHIIFSAKPSERAFWTGEKSGTRDPELIRRGGPKPCLHGCDAHDIDRVLQPVDDRRCWIKGELCFDTLRQALHEPAARTFIGADPPPGPSDFERIDRVSVSSAPWLVNDSFALNPGLVAIIGPKGSGKTALADMIARGADSFDDTKSDASFLRKAKTHLGAAEVTVTWGDTSSDTRPLLGPASGADDPTPRVRYLSQQFVEQVCSADGIGRALVEEIEVVVFRAVDPSDRLGASTFQELREARIAPLVRRRVEFQEGIRRATQQFDTELKHRESLPSKRRKLTELDKEIAATEKNLKDLLVKGKEDRMKHLSALDIQIQQAERIIASYKSRIQQLEELRSEVGQTRRRWVELVADWKTRFTNSGLTDQGWTAFIPQFSGKVDDVLDAVKREAERAIEIETNGPIPQTPGTPERAPLATLRKSAEELRKELGTDAVRERRYKEVSERLAKQKGEREKLTIDLAFSEKWQERWNEARTLRHNSYAGLLQTLIEEEAVLKELYAPLAARLRGETDVVSKLSFFVHRRVDLAKWVERGEAVLDLRKKGPFQGRDALMQQAERMLLSVWQRGSREEAADAMFRFIEEHELTNPRQILAQDATFGAFVEWLFSADHIRVEYGIQYENVDIAHLSPGMRGIVLLLLYLAIDQWDSRPLIVDQPEENLDPKSVFEELVKYFRKVRRRRQVIIVTHNANLVVNTDADQIIVASSARVPDAPLPQFSYDAGALEDEEIRKIVCAVLEGGEEAFRQRERRYALPAT